MAPKGSATGSSFARQFRNEDRLFGGGSNGVGHDLFGAGAQRFFHGVSQRPNGVAFIELMCQRMLLARVLRPNRQNKAGSVCP